MKSVQYLFIAVLAVVLFLACTGEKEQGQTERSVAVKATVVVSGDREVALTYTGSLEGEQQANLYAKLSEAVDRVPVREGQSVSANQTVISLDKSGPSTQYNATRSVYLNAEKNVKKLESLFKEGAVSESEYDGAKTTFEVVRGNFEAVERLVDIRTPIAGVVTSVSVSPGDYVYAGQQLATIATTQSLRIKFGVKPEDVAFATVGAAVSLKAESGVSAQGKVVTVARSADPVTRTFQVEALVENKDGAFKPGMFAQVHMVKATLSGVLVVPRSAVLALGNEHVVFSIASGVAHRRVVTLGTDLDGSVVVNSGLSAGDTLVTLGQNYLDDGFKVKLTGLDEAGK